MSSEPDPKLPKPDKQAPASRDPKAAAVLATEILAHLDSNLVADSPVRVQLAGLRAAP